MLEKKRFTFANCKYLCVDETDRMADLGFEDDARNIIIFFKVRPPWTCVVFDPISHDGSANIRRSVQDFAWPTPANVGRAGAANLDVDTDESALAKYVAGKLSVIDKELVGEVNGQRA